MSLKNCAAKKAVGIALFLQILCGAGALDFFSIDVKNGDTRKAAREFVAQMSDEDALAQTLMLGWGSRTAQDAEPTPELLEWIERRGIGGIKVFGWNTPEDTVASTETLVNTIGVYQKTALSRPLKIPLLVATDQEGGVIRHVKGATSVTPGNMALGAAGVPRDAYLEGLYIGRELAALGVNMNFAPTVDLFTDQRSTLIGTRSFGDNPVHAGLLGAAYAKGTKDAGVIATAKHFPGHGDTALDSHGVLPRIASSIETLRERELVPYDIMIREGLPAIMSAHVAFPNTEARGDPASLSPYFLDTVLRRQMGFDGLIVTDEISMNGATFVTGTQWGAAIRALKAGNDIIMRSGNPIFGGDFWSEILGEMRRDAKFKARVREAAERVIAIKLEYLRGDGAPPLEPLGKKAVQGMPAREAEDFHRDLTARSATIVVDKGVFPVTAQNAGRVLISGPSTEFNELGKKAFPGAKSVWAHTNFLSLIMSMAREADTVIFCLESEAEFPILRALRALKCKLVVISVKNPVNLKEFSWVDGAVTLYSNSNDALKAGFSVITGRIEAVGGLPFALWESD